jgi:hypothetical protein
MPETKWTFHAIVISCIVNVGQPSTRHRFCANHFFLGSRISPNKTINQTFFSWSQKAIFQNRKIKACPSSTTVLDGFGMVFGQTRLIARIQTKTSERELVAP